MSSEEHRTPPPKTRRLRTWLLGALAVLVAVPLVLLVLVPPLVNIRQEREQLTRQLETLAEAEVISLLRWVEVTSADLNVLATSEQIRPGMLELVTSAEAGEGAASYAAARESFTQYARSIEKSYNRVLLLDMDGVVRGSSDLSLVNRSLGGEAWFRAAADAPATPTITISGPLRDPTDGQMSLYFSRLVVDDHGNRVGVLTGRTSVETLRAILALTPAWGETADFYLVRAGRQYVVPPRLGMDLMVATDEVVTTALTGANGSGSWQDYRGQSVIGVYRWIEPLNMALVLKQDVSETLAVSRGLMRAQLIVGALAALMAIGLALFIVRRLTGALARTSSFASRIADGDLALRVPGSRLLEVNELATAFNEMTGRVSALLASQEARIEARTRALAITARIGHVIASETDYNRLLQTTIETIGDQLGYYHTQVYLLDDLRQYAVLRASTGEAGSEMVANGHKLAVGSPSVVGQATEHGEPVLASATHHPEYWSPNPLLPATSAELAIPLRLGDQVVGALDIQATEPDVFDEPTIGLLQTVADQLAVAIRNAQLFEEKESLLSASLELTQMLTRDNWDTYVSQRKAASSTGFAYDLSEVRPLSEPVSDGNGGGLQLPIALRGAVIGELTAQLGEGHALADEDKQLVEQVLDRVALAIDNARLVEQTQLSLMETNRLYLATQSIAGANTVDELVQVLIPLTELDAVDRAFLFLLERSDQPPGRRWVDVAGMWLRDPGDPLRDLPGRLRTGEHSLLRGIEAVQSGLHISGDIAQTSFGPQHRAELEELGVRSLAVFPIVPPIPGRSPLGWLVLHSTRLADAFDEATNRFFSTVAGQAAIALESLRLFEQTQERARRLQATNDVSRVASSILTPDILLSMIVDRISEAFGYYHVQIFLVDELREWAVLRASTGEVGQELLHRGHRLAIGSRSVIGQVLETGEAVIVRDTDLDPLHLRNELLPATRAEMAIPLQMGERIIGALDLQSTAVGTFDAEDQAILQSLADQIAVTLENAQLFQEIQDRVAELTTVNLVSQTVSRAQTLEELYAVVTEQLMQQFGAQYGFLGVLDKKGLLHLPIFFEGGERLEPPSPQPVGQGLSGWVIKNRQVLLLNENTEQAARDLGVAVVDTMPRSLVMVPLTLGDEVIGVISMQDAEREHAYDEADVRQLTTLAAYIAVKIRNAELLDEAQHRADELGFLFEITRTAVSSSHLPEALSSVGNLLLREIEGAEAAVFYLAVLDDDSFEAQAAAGYGRDLVARQVRVAPTEGLVGVATSRRQVTALADARPWARQTAGGSRTRAAIVVPLTSGQQMLGVLTVESSQLDVFSENAVRLLEGASSTLAAVIQNVRLLEQITQANEQLRELDKLKSQFLANMSHELRTPLNSIIGFSRVMLKGIDGPLNDLQEQDLTTIYNSGQHLLGLINNILDVSKIEAGKMEIQPEYISLHEIIEGVIATGRGLVKDRPIQINKEVGDSLPDAYADPVRVRQVLLNLMSNAAKFTREGNITIRATRQPSQPGSGQPAHIRIDVADTGIGIAQEDMSKLFEAFSQVDGSTTRQVGGTGLGLTITKEFVELMGGRIWVESEVGVGSTFSFTIPLHPPGMELAEVVVATGENGDRPLVLAVDDEPGVLELYARYLEKGGYALVGLSNANDLIDRVRDTRPAVVIVDLNLPGRTGWDAVAELRQTDDTSSVPVIICSIDDDRARARELGVAAYLVKPVIEDDLLGAIGQVIEGRASAIEDVLILDPDGEYALEMGAALEAAYGCTVRVCSTGLAGLEAVQEHLPSVMIADVDLPDMDGYGLLMAMRTQDDLCSVPVVIVSARELAEAELEPLNPAATRYLQKTAHAGNRLFDDLAAVLAGFVP